MYQYRGDTLLGGDNREQLGLAAQAGWNSLTEAGLDVPSSKRHGPGEERSSEELGGWLVQLWYLMAHCQLLGREG